MIRKNKFISRKRRARGFTLVEVALVVVISGVIFSTLAGAYTVYSQMSQTSTVKTNLATIDQAIQNFLVVNGRLPCPASLTAAPDSPSFGVEPPLTVGVSPTCTAPAGTIEVNPGVDAVMIGAVPVRALNLPDQFSLDPWKNRYSYAVAKNLATQQLFDPAKGKITINDGNGNQVVQVPGAYYVIVSHGPDGAGAYTAQGVAGASCPTAGKDMENCTAPIAGVANSIFTKPAQYSAAAGANHFDDFMAFRGMGNASDTTCGDKGMIYGPLYPIVAGKDAQNCLLDMRIDTTNRNVAIGMPAALTPSSPLTVRKDGTDDIGTTFRSVAAFLNSGNKGLYLGYDTGAQLGSITSQGASSGISFSTHNGTAWGERLRIHTDGNVGIGTTVPSVLFHVAEGSSANPRGMMLSQHSNDNNGSLFSLRKSRGTVAAPSAVSNGDNIGNIMADAYDGSVYVQPARIRFAVDGAVAAGSVPTALQFFTGSAGAGGTERMRIDSAGNVGIGTASPAALLHLHAASGSNPSFELTDADVAHGITQFTLTTDTIFRVTNVGSTQGGAWLTGASSDAGVQGLVLNGLLGVTDPTDSVAAILLSGSKKSGANRAPLGSSETVLQVENGMPTSGTALMTILGSGNVGIGTASPSSKLHVSGAGNLFMVGTFDNSTNNLFWYGGHDSAGGYIEQRGNTSTGTSDRLRLQSSVNGGAGANYSQFFIDPKNGFSFSATGTANSNVGIGTLTPGVKLDVVGEVRATTFTYSSDERLKSDIETLTGSLDKINSLRGVSFVWKDGGHKDIGVIAQDVEKVYPDLVKTNPDTGMKSVAYGNLIGPVIEAIKQLYSDLTGQSQKIAEQEKKIDALEAQMKELQTQINDLKAD